MSEANNKTDDATLPGGAYYVAPGYFLPLGWSLVVVGLLAGLASFYIGVESSALDRRSQWDVPVTKKLLQWHRSTLSPLPAILDAKHRRPARRTSSVAVA